MAQFRSSLTEAARTLWAYGIQQAELAQYILQSMKTFPPKKSGPGELMRKASIGARRSPTITVDTSKFATPRAHYSFGKPRANMTGTLSLKSIWGPRLPTGYRTKIRELATTGSSLGKNMS